MPKNIENSLIIGISTRALFDLTYENSIFETQGVEAYCKYQLEHENDVLKPGPGFALVKSLLSLNDRDDCGGIIEVIVMSRNSPDTSLRIFNSIRYYGLDITRSALVSGASLAPYLAAFGTDLFLSAYEDDVQAAIDSGIAAGIICTDYNNNMQDNIIPLKKDETIRIAFDGDAVIFTDASEKIYKEQGLLAFEENERINACMPLEEGPFAKFLKKLSLLQKKFAGQDCPIRIALVTSRSAPAHERVIRTLRSWNVRMDEAFFLGGIEKREFLAAFGAQIFFDDQSIHTQSAAKAVPSARVPYKNMKVI